LAKEIDVGEIREPFPRTRDSFRIWIAVMVDNRLQAAEGATDLRT
jgi:hypothetical protein